VWGSETGSAFRAATRALDRAVEAAVEGTPTHPSGTTFVPADVAERGRLTLYRRLGPVSIVDADGNEIRLRQYRASAATAGLTLMPSRPLAGAALAAW
jgi:hypothetical protein